MLDSFYLIHSVSLVLHRHCLAIECVFVNRAQKSLIHRFSQWGIYLCEKLLPKNKAFLVVHCLSQNIFPCIAYYMVFKSFIFLPTKIVFENCAPVWAQIKKQQLNLTLGSYINCRKCERHTECVTLAYICQDCPMRLSWIAHQRWPCARYRLSEKKLSCVCVITQLHWKHSSISTIRYYSGKSWAWHYLSESCICFFELKLD